MIAPILLAALAAAPPPAHAFQLTDTDVQLLNAIVQRTYVGSRCAVGDHNACLIQPALDDLARYINAQIMSEKRSEVKK